MLGPDKGPLPKRGIRVKQDKPIARGLRRSLERNFLEWLDQDSVAVKFKKVDMSENTFDGVRKESDWNELRDNFRDWLDDKLGVRSEEGENGSIGLLYDWNESTRFLDEVYTAFLVHIDELDEDDFYKQLKKVEDDEKKRLQFVQQWFKAQIRGIEQNCPHLVAERKRQLEGIMHRVEGIDWMSPELITLDGVPDLWKTQMTRLSYSADGMFTDEDLDNDVIGVRVPVRKAEGDEREDPDVWASVQEDKDWPMMVLSEKDEAKCTYFMVQTFDEDEFREAKSERLGQLISEDKPIGINIISRDEMIDFMEDRSECAVNCIHVLGNEGIEEVGGDKYVTCNLVPCPDDYEGPYFDLENKYEEGEKPTKESQRRGFRGHLRWMISENPSDSGYFVLADTSYMKERFVTQN
jgi:hypothetical protein